MRKASVILLCAIFLGSCTHEEVNFQTGDCYWSTGYQNHPYQKAYQAEIDSLTHTGVVGINLLIARPGEQLWIGSSGLSRIENNKPIVPCHVMPCGSVSKMFTGLAALRMYEEGLLDLDASIEQYLGTELTAQIPNGNQVKIYHLLSHTSGIPDFVSSPGYLHELINNKDFFAGPEQVLREYVLNKNPEFDPGKDYLYSNSNFEILSLIMDEIYEDGYPDYFSNRVLDKLGVRNTYYKNETDYYTLDTKGMANGYFDRFGDGNLENATEISLAITAALTGSAGIVSNVIDIHTLLRAIFNADMITEDTLEKVKDYVLKKEGLTEYQFGLGVSYKTFGSFGQAIGHTGKAPGFTSEAWYFPEKNTYVVYQINTGVALESKYQKTIDEDFRQNLLATVFSH